MDPIDQRLGIEQDYDFADETRTIWRELKRGSLGTVLWAIERDERVVGAFADALGVSDDLSALAECLEYPVLAASNALGQVVLHQLAGDESQQLHMEPRDFRWGPLLAFTPDALQWTTIAIAHHPPFIKRLRHTLSAAVRAITLAELGRNYDLHALAQTRELYQEFLISLGIALAQVLSPSGKNLTELLGEIRVQNQNFQAPLYTFQKKPRDSYYRLGC